MTHKTEENKPPPPKTKFKVMATVHFAGRQRSSGEVIQSDQDLEERFPNKVRLMSEDGRNVLPHPIKRARAEAETEGGEDSPRRVRRKKKKKATAEETDGTGGG